MILTRAGEPFGWGHGQCSWMKSCRETCSLVSLQMVLDYWPEVHIGFMAVSTTRCGRVPMDKSQCGAHQRTCTSTTVRTPQSLSALDYLCS